jgi:hypothetical protein
MYRVGSDQQSVVMGHLQSTVLGTLHRIYYSGHVTQSILCWTRYTESTMLDTLHRVHYAGHVTQNLLCWTRYTEYTMLDTLHRVYYAGHVTESTMLDTLHRVYCVGPLRQSLLFWDCLHRASCKYISLKAPTWYTWLVSVQPVRHVSAHYRTINTDCVFLAMKVLHELQWIS